MFLIASLTCAISGAKASIRLLGGYEDHDSNMRVNQVLLILQVLIRRDKHIEVTVRGLHQLAVLLAGPAHFRNRPHNTIYKLAFEFPGQALIQQNARRIRGIEQVERPSLFLRKL
jgi:hypothetical protein